MNEVFYTRIGLIFSVKHTGNQYNSRMYVNTFKKNFIEMIQKVFWLKIEDDALHISRQILRSTRNFVASHEIEPAERQRKLICFVQQMKPWLCCSPKRHLILRKQPDTDVFFVA